ncbi:MAG: hypothetical protein RDV48_06865 [Candidatus Eremiobacteraeota bacterium]|nr:hypothetical protein [Candidatus Eremiobacteraeota bacterium]
MENSQIGKEINKEIAGIWRSLGKTFAGVMAFLLISLVLYLAFFSGYEEICNVIPGFIVLGILIAAVLPVIFPCPVPRSSSSGDEGSFCDGGLESSYDDYYCDAGIGY